MFTLFSLATSHRRIIAPRNFSDSTNEKWGEWHDAELGGKNLRNDWEKKQPKSKTKESETPQLMPAADHKPAMTEARTLTCVHTRSPSWCGK